MKIRVKAKGDVVTKKGGNGKPYQVFELFFHDLERDQGKSRQVMSFSKAFKPLSTANVGEVFDILDEMNEKSGYWDWNGATSQGVDTTPVDVKEEATGAAVASSKGDVASARATTVKNTYETPEERAFRVTASNRSYSIGHALKFYELDKSGYQPDTDDIIRVAKTFYAYVVDSEVVDEETGEITGGDADRVD